MTKNTKVGLTVIKAQPLHKGYTHIINKMVEDCDIVIVGIGSAQLSGTESDPYTIEARIEMLRRVYSDRIKIIPLNDLGAKQGSDDWVNYVISRIIKIGLPTPTDYYAGSRADYLWYRSFFTTMDRRCHQATSQERLGGVFTIRSEDIRSLVKMNDKWIRIPEIPNVILDIVIDEYPEKYKINY